MRRFDLIVTCVCFALLGYFAWHALQGPRGYPYRDALIAQAGQLEAKFELEQQQRVRLEKRVGLLRPESIDPDMLEELARAKLQLVRPSDLVAYTTR